MTTCTCRLSDLGLAFFDAVCHEADCALMHALEASIAETHLPPSAFTLEALEGKWVVTGWDSVRWSPGIEG